MSWTNSVVLEFLELYRTEQMIWDSKHPMYRNRSEVNDAWTRIQNSLSIPCSITDLKKKKESLMTSFRMHLSRKRKSPPDYRVTWFAYPLMESFLGGKYECEISTLNNDPLQYESNGFETISIKADSAANKRKFKKTGGPDSKNFKKESVADNVEIANIVTVNYDEYDLYGQLLVKKLRKLDERQRDFAMHEIDNIMFNAKMQSSAQVEHTSRSFTSTPTPEQGKMKSQMFIVQQPGTYEEENLTYEQQPT